jgi:hypothetical protein
MKKLLLSMITALTVASTPAQGGEAVKIAYATDMSNLKSGLYVEGVPNAINLSHIEEYAGLELNKGKAKLGLNLNTENILNPFELYGGFLISSGFPSKNNSINFGTRVGLEAKLNKNFSLDLHHENIENEGKAIRIGIKYSKN